MIFHARYYDGITAEPHNVLLNLGISALWIQIPDETSMVEWAYANVQMIEKPEYERPLIIGNRLASNARIIVNDSRLYDVLMTKIPRKNAPLISISTSSKSLALWSIAAAAMMIGIYRLAPELAAPIAKHFPDTWEKSLGEYTVYIITGGRPVCKNTAGVKALNKLVHRLNASADNHPLIVTNVILQKEINAFAAPGGRIIIFNKLIETAGSPDELAGVIAHEMGHVIKHHPTQGLVRVLGLELVIKMVFGGVGNTSTTASTANELFQLQYNRNFEREADQIATQILYDSHIDNRGFVTFFLRLQSEEKGADKKIFSYISTHPATSERIDTIRKAKNTVAATPILNGEEWQALKNICRPTASAA